MVPTQLNRFETIVTAAVIVLAILAALRWFIPTGPTQTEQELSAKLQVAESMAIEKGKQAILLQKDAAQMQQTIAILQQQLKTNQINTHEKATHVYAIAPDSLASHIAAQIVALDSAWY